jgi:hypothetical protein
MWNAGADPARIIEVYTPGGFELFLDDLDERLRQGPMSLHDLNRVGAPYGIRFFDDRTAELKAAHGLRVVGEPDDWALDRSWVSEFRLSPAGRSRPSLPNASELAQAGS